MHSFDQSQARARAGSPQRTTVARLQAAGGRSAGRESERGIALPLALVLLVALGMVATAATTMSRTDLRISSAYASGNRALDAAEAAIEHGLVELTARSRAGEDPDGAVILSDTLDGYAYTVTAFSKREHSGEGGRDFNNDGDQTDVVRYDRSFGYAGAGLSGAAGNAGYPVKILVAVATEVVPDSTKGRTRARAEIEIARDRLNVGLNAPLQLNSPVNAMLTGSLEVDGRLHDKNGNLIASGTLNPPYGSAGASKTAAEEECNYWKPAVKIPSEGELIFQGNVSATGHVAFDQGGLLGGDDDDDDDEGKGKGKGGGQNYNAEDPLSTFKFTPEDLLGVAEGTLDAYKKDAAKVTDFKNLSGVNYITSGDVPSQISGSGILIVHNPNYDVKKFDCVNFPTTCKPGYALDPKNKPMSVKINANGTFKGIIIVDQLERVNGNFTLLGSLASLGTAGLDIPGNGNASIKWSCQAVQDAAGQGSDYSVKLWWKHGMEE